MASGSLKYLTVRAFKDCGFSSHIGDYKVLINPDKFSQSFSIEYNKKQAQGEPNTSIKYAKSPPSTMTFQLVFDATGVVDPSRTDLPTEIKNFKKLVYDYNGDIHSPNYLKLTWGNALTFQCRLESLKLEYKLFAPNGNPLRAMADVSFVEYQSPKQIQNEAGKNSPDMTHLIQVVAGDTLPALCYTVYGDSKYYVQVARFNKLFNYRNLKPGSTLQFPPLT